jgi:hypothetical protein
VGSTLGIAQFPLLYDRVRTSAVLIPIITGLWALGWTVSTGTGVDPDDPTVVRVRV